MMNLAEYMQTTAGCVLYSRDVVDAASPCPAQSPRQAQKQALPLPNFAVKLDNYLRSNLKFRNLQFLVTLDDTRHIGKTAQYLHVSQPAISKTLAAFEEGLNLKLFERSTRGMEPTEAGTCLIRFARKMLSELSSVRDELNDINLGRATRLSLGILPVASFVILPHFIGEIESRMATVSVVVREGTSDMLISMLRSGEVDLVVSNLTQKVSGCEFEKRLLYKDPVVVVVRKDHPLADKPDVTWQDVSHYAMVLPPVFASTRPAIEEFLMRHDVRISRSHVESLSILTNIGVICSSNSAGFLSKQLADYFSRNDSVTILPLSIDLTIDVGLVWLRERKFTPAQKSGIELFSHLQFGASGQPP
ncbi:MAG: LysR family transcriptional regulator [Zoogloeaceae bacterium]|jgi:DNA-binding transcriptional LysR family regulator|nr:LysR family transcriptional regulator [Zoogloeaceae bacterium]